MTKNINEKFRSPKQIEEIYGIKTQTLYYWIRTHQLAHHKINKIILIKECDLEEFLSIHREEVRAD